MKIKTYNLDELIKKNGYTRTTLAQELGVSRWTIRNWVLNICPPSEDMPYQVAGLLGVHPKHIWSDLVFDDSLVKKYKKPLHSV